MEKAKKELEWKVKEGSTCVGSIVVVSGSVGCGVGLNDLMDVDACEEDGGRGGPSLWMHYHGLDCQTQWSHSCASSNSCSIDNVEKASDMDAEKEVILGKDDKYTKDDKIKNKIRGNDGNDKSKYNTTENDKTNEDDVKYAEIKE
eukprot:15365760-Ditylum_brightwellii.AAC.1